MIWSKQQHLLGSTALAPPGYVVSDKAAVPAEGKVVEGHGAVRAEAVWVQEDCGI